LESLKSKKSAELRRTQLSLIYPILARSEMSVLCGDFNFCSTWPEEQLPNITEHELGRTFTDVWPHLRGSEPGWTEDTEVNHMLAQSKRGKKQVRFDRALVRSQCDHASATSSGAQQQQQQHLSTLTRKPSASPRLRHAHAPLVRLVPEKVTILGKEQIALQESDPCSNQPLWPSDHFGLYSMYSLAIPQ
jgi:hypothetical protein